MPVNISEDIRGMWNNRIVVGTAVRAKDPDRQLVGFNNAGEYAGAKGAISAQDDGNLNYGKGDVISSRIQYTTDLELRYRNLFGIYGKARGWYDYTGKKDHVPHGSIATGYVPDRKLDDSDYYDYNTFSNYELLDRYIYGNWNIGEIKLAGRLGHQTVNWGESLLHTGINAFNPIDFSALGRPGVRQDSALIPVNRIYTNLITRNGVSIEGFYDLGWQGSRAPPCGTFASPSDFVIDPGCNYATAPKPLSDRELYNYAPPGQNPFLTPSLSQEKPDGGGYGVAGRYFVEALDTEFGLYFVDFSATIPVIDIRLCDKGPTNCSSLDGLALSLNYPDDVKGFGLSSSTGVRNLTLSAELSYFQNWRLQRGAELIEGANEDRGIYAARMRSRGDGQLFDGGWKADRSKLLLGGVLDLYSATGLADALLVAEFSGQWISNLPGTDEERLGRAGNWGAAADGDFCPLLTQGTEGGCKIDGFATDYSWGYRVFTDITLPRPARGVELHTQLAWNHDVDGYAGDGSLVEGRRLINLRLQVIFQSSWFIEIGRTWINSNTDYDSARDKDTYTIAAGVAF
jgi:hypothetical protein